MKSIMTMGTVIIMDTDMGMFMKNCMFMIPTKSMATNAQDKLQLTLFTKTSNSQATSRNSFTQTKTSRKN